MNFLTKLSESIKSGIKSLNITKKQKMLVGIMAFFLLIGLTVAAGANKQIRIVVDPDESGASAETQEISAHLLSDVHEIVRDQGYDIDNEYTTEVPEGKKVKDVDVVVLHRNPEGVVRVDGQVIYFNSKAETIAELLDEKGITVDDDDEVAPAKETPLTTEIKEVSVARIEVKEESGEREVPFEQEQKENSEVDEGTTQVTTAGVNGKVSFIDRVTYRDGAEIARENIQNTVLVEPVKEITEIGTKKASSSRSSSGTISDRTSYSGESPQGIAQRLLAEYGWSDQWDSFNSLIQKESGWNPYACNSSSGAYGLGQALPGSKMASVGSDWETNPETQLRWTLGYIAGRYGDPDGAWAAFQSKGWY